MCPGILITPGDNVNYISGPHGIVHWSNTLDQGEKVITSKALVVQTDFVLVECLPTASYFHLDAFTIQYWQSGGKSQLISNINTYIGKSVVWLMKDYWAPESISAAPSKQEKPCITCGRNNDVGVATCWMCGASQ